MKQLLTTIIFLSAFGALNADIIQPNVKKTSGFFHVSGKNYDNEVEEHYLRMDSILRISIFEQAEEDKKKVFVVYIITHELDTNFRDAIGPDHKGIAGASDSSAFRMIFNSHKEASDFISILVSESKSAEQDAALKVQE